MSICVNVSTFQNSIDSLLQMFHGSTGPVACWVNWQARRVFTAMRPFTLPESAREIQTGLITTKCCFMGEIVILTGVWTSW